MTLRESERARSFGRVAHDYDRLRPSPPEAVVDWLVGTDTKRAVEVGAGTGRFSRILAERIPDFRATEPDPRMREYFADNTPNIPIMAGTAEDIPVENGSMDAVFSADSWHWFEPERTFTEIARVLRPGGRLGVYWNGVDETVPWVHEFFSVVRRNFQGQGLPGHFALPDTGDLAARFTEPEALVVPWTRSMPIDDLVAWLGTYSPVLAMPESERAAVYARSREFLGTLPEHAGRDVIDVPYRARCWLTRLDPAAARA